MTKFQDIWDLTALCRIFHEKLVSHLELELTLKRKNKIKGKQEEIHIIVPGIPFVLEIILAIPVHINQGAECNF